MKILPPGCIYALAASDGIRYVGQTKAPATRLGRHLMQARSRDNHVHRWIRQLAVERQETPELIVLERCEIQQMDERERWWIAWMRERQVDLCNHTEGGQWGRVDEGSRRKISEAYRRHLADPENYARFLKRVRDPERCRKISEGNRGKKMSAEAIAKTQAGRALARAEGRWDPAEHVRRNPAWAAGQQKSRAPNARAKAGMSNKRVWANYTPEQRQARGDAIRAGMARAKAARGDKAKP